MTLHEGHTLSHNVFQLLKNLQYTIYFFYNNMILHLQLLGTQVLNYEPYLSERDEVEEVEDITVRILSPQSVAITWVDPLVKKQKNIPEGTR